MKSIRSLRFLSLLGFLLLIAPFYDMCNGHGMRREAPAQEEVMADTTAVVIDTIAVQNKPIILVEKEPLVDKDTMQEIKVEQILFYQKAYNFVDDAETLNAYEFAILSMCLFEGSFSEFKKGIKEGIKENNYSAFFLYLKIYCFLFIVLFSIAIVILSFCSKVKLICKFSKINIVLLLITIICTLFFDPFFETYKQFKWGYYAFTLVQLGIFYTSKIQISSPK